MFVTNEGGKALTSGREKSFFLSFSHQYDDSVKTTQRWPVVIDAMVTIRPAAIMMKEFEGLPKISTSTRCSIKQTLSGVG